MQYRILTNDCAENPNQENCFIVYDHRDFTVEVDGFEPYRIWKYLQLKEIFKNSKLDDFEDCSQEAAEYSDYLNLEDEFVSYLIYPLYAYIHSGVALSLGKTSYPFDCQWDTSMKGFLITTKDYDGDVNKFIEVWNDYLMNGELMVEIYEEIKCECCGHTSEEEIDLIGGFYNYEEAEEYGKDYCTRNTSRIEL